MIYLIKYKKLDNGIGVYYIKVKSDDITVIANTTTGPLYESEKNKGISHLIEHLLFKGTPSRKNRDSIYNEINLLGGVEFCYTDTFSIPLGMRVLSKDFEPTLELIADLLYNSNMNQEEISKEKNIVLSEIRQREDDPFVCIWDIFEETLFDGTLLAQPRIGKANIIQALTHKEILDYYKKTFVPKNTKLFIVGPENFKDILKKVNKYFDRFISNCNQKFPPVVKLLPNKAKIKIIQKEIDQSHIKIGRTVPSSNHRDTYALEVLGHILSRTINDIFLNKKSISYSSNAGYYKTKYAGIIFAEAASERKNIEEIQRAIISIFTKFSKGDISKNYFIDSKKIILKSYLLGNCSTMDIAKNALNKWLEGDIQSINRYEKGIKNVTLKQVQKVAKDYLKTDDLLTVIMGK